jgi:hypothetical protein
MQLSICTQCDRAVFVDDDEEPFVVLRDGSNMHADCYDEMQAEAEKQEAKKSTGAKA